MKRFARLSLNLTGGEVLALIAKNIRVARAPGPIPAKTPATAPVIYLILSLALLGCLFAAPAPIWRRARLLRGAILRLPLSGLFAAMSLPNLATAGASPGHYLL